MNKKILSLAIAAAVAAPMAAQAEVKFSGSVAMDMYSTDGKLNGSDAGTSKLNIDFGDGDAFARMAWDIRPAGKSGTYDPTTATDDTTLTTWQMPGREQYAGIKVGGAKIMLGRIANLSSKVIYGADTMNATFLEARGKAGSVAKVESFDSGMLQVGFKAGDVGIDVAYGGADVDQGAAKNRMQALVTAKAGPVDLGLGYDQDSAGSDATTAVSGKMKFGGVNLAVLLEQDAGKSIIFADASMDMGGVTLDLGIGSNTSDSTSFSRLAVVKKMGSTGRVYAGVSNPNGGPTTAGFGVRVDM